MDKFLFRKNKFTDKSVNSKNRDAYFTKKYANRLKSEIDKLSFYLQKYESFSQIFAGVEPDQLKDKINPQKSESDKIIENRNTDKKEVDSLTERRDSLEKMKKCLDQHLRQEKELVQSIGHEIDKNFRQLFNYANLPKSFHEKYAEELLNEKQAKLLGDLLWDTQRHLIITIPEIYNSLSSTERNNKIDEIKKCNNDLKQALDQYFKPIRNRRDKVINKFEQCYKIINENAMEYPILSEGSDKCIERLWSKLDSITINGNIAISYINKFFFR